MKIKNKINLLNKINIFANPFVTKIGNIYLSDVMESKSIEELKIWIELVEDEFIDIFIYLYDTSKKGRTKKNLLNDVFKKIEELNEKKINELILLMLIDNIIIGKYRMEFAIERGFKPNNPKHNSDVMKQPRNKNVNVSSPLEIQVSIYRLLYEIIGYKKDDIINFINLLDYKGFERGSLPRYDKLIKERHNSIEKEYRRIYKFL